MRRLTLFIPVLLFSCTAGIDLKSVDYTVLFTDSNSKVWLVNKVIIENANIAPAKNEGKDVLIFHDNGRCDLIPMKDIARKGPRKGNFTLDSDNRKLTIDFQDRTKWNFDLPYITEDSILLNAEDGSKTPFSIQIIPFPEL